MAFSLRRKKKDDESGESKKQEKPPEKVEDSGDQLPPRKMNKFVLAGGIAFAVMIVGAVVLAKLYVDEELKRETQAWQVRLGIVADSRTAAVNDWIDGNFKVLRELTQNASLQLYMSELASAPDPNAVAPTSEPQSVLPCLSMPCRKAAPAPRASAP